MSYWQHLAGSSSQAFVEVPDTLAFRLNRVPGANSWDGLSGVHGSSFSGGFAGTNQATRGYVDIDVLNDRDDVTPDPRDSMWTVAHEYGHALIMCHATPGIGCGDANPADQPVRAFSTWRGVVHDSAVENLANMYGNLLTMYAGVPAGLEGSGWVPDWNYDHYFSTRDSFGNYSEDSAGGINCPATSCPSTHVCLTGTNLAPTGNPAGFCARTCATDADCVGSEGRNPAMFCQPSSNRNATSPIPARNVCLPLSNYSQQFFNLVGGRMVHDMGWRSAMQVLASATSGNSGNGTRDFFDAATGSDSWYNALAVSLGTRYEAMRAVAALRHPQAAMARVEDFTNSPRRAVPIPYVPTGDAAGVPVFWGNGWAAYPNFEGLGDVDYVLFRGQQGVNYRITAAPVGSSPVSVGVAVFGWTAAQPLINDTDLAPGASAEVQTGPLSATGWYLVRFTNQLWNSGAWQARIRTVGASTSDDFNLSGSEAYPMASGQSITGELNSASDYDGFAIDVPVTGTSLTVTTSPSRTITLYRPTSATSWSWHSSGSGALSIPSVPAVGKWVWLVSGAPGAYTTSATIGCASGSAPCDDPTLMLAQSVRFAWGDQFAGRLPVSGATATYSITVNANEDFTASLAHNDPSCNLVLDAIPPWTSPAFNAGPQLPVWSWSDGAAVNQPTGYANNFNVGTGPGGHITALQAGTWNLRVRNASAAGTCSGFRLFVARSDHYNVAMPGW